MAETGGCLKLVNKTLGSSPTQNLMQLLCNRIHNETSE